VNDLGAPADALVTGAAGAPVFTRAAYRLGSSPRRSDLLSREKRGELVRERPTEERCAVIVGHAAQPALR
jgi:hypothetical protein